MPGIRKLLDKELIIFFVIIGTVLTFFLDVAFKFHKFVRFLCTIHIFVKSIVALRFIVATLRCLIDVLPR